MANRMTNFTVTSYQKNASIRKRENSLEPNGGLSMQ